MTEFFCRPWKSSGHGTGTGLSYDNAWAALSYRVGITSADPATNVITIPNDNMGSNSVIYTNSPVYFTAAPGGAVPGGITVRQRYFCKNTGTWTFTISETPGGGDVDITDAGSGTIYMNIGVDWDAVSAGDTIWLCGEFGSDETFPKAAGHVEVGNLTPFTQLTIRKSGSAGLPIRIRADHPTYPGKIFRSASTFQIGCGGWVVADAGAPNVYKNRYAPSSAYYLFENKVLMNVKKTLSAPPTLGELQAMGPGDWGYYDYYIYVYPKATANPNPNNNQYICPTYPASIITNPNTDELSYIEPKHILCYGGDVSLFNLHDSHLFGIGVVAGKEPISVSPTNYDCYNNTIDGDWASIVQASFNGIYLHKGTAKYHHDYEIKNYYISHINGEPEADNHGVGINTGYNLKVHDLVIDDCNTGVTGYTDSYELGLEVYNIYAKNIFRGQTGDSSPGSGHGYGVDYHGTNVGAVPVSINFHDIIVDSAAAGAIRITAYPNTASTIKVNNIVAKGCNIGVCAYTGASGTGLKADIKNVIVIDPVDFGDGLPVCYMYAWAGGGADMDEFLIDYNCYHGGTATPFHYSINGVIENKSFAAWKTAMQVFVPADETHSFEADPLLCNGSGSYGLDSDYKLSPISPCIDAGVAVVGRSIDYAGLPVPCGSAPDIGPFEFVGGSAILERRRRR